MASSQDLRPFHVIILEMLKLVKEKDCRITNMMFDVGLNHEQIKVKYLPYLLNNELVERIQTSPKRYRLRITRKGENALDALEKLGKYMPEFNREKA